MMSSSDCVRSEAETLHHADWLWPLALNSAIFRSYSFRSCSFVMRYDLLLGLLSHARKTIGMWEEFDAYLEIAKNAQYMLLLDDFK